MEEKINAVFFAIHPPPIEDRGFLAHGVLKEVDLEAAVTKYLLDAGMAESDILMLKEKLS